MSNEPARAGQEPLNAYVVLTIGTIIGIGLLILPFIFVSWWWEPLHAALLEGQRSDIWKPGLVLFGVLIALATMFACLQSARKFERTDPALRRVIYGYNASLTGLLLLALLVIINVAVHIWYPRHLDTTEGGFFSLSEATQEFVTELTQPVKVYVVLPEAEEARLGVETLLSQMRELNPKQFTFDDVSPQLDRSLIRELKKKFPQLEGECLIVSFGEPEGKNYSIIPASELINLDFDQMSGQSRREFRGEVRLLQELNHLAGGKKKTVIYVTQGHGEPDLNDRNKDGLSLLQQKLTQNNYEVRPFRVPANVVPENAAFPADADIVLVIGPTSSIADLKYALENYLSPADPGKPKGHLIALLGPTAGNRKPGNAMVETGMEEILRRFNVDVTREVIYTFGQPRGSRIAIDESPEIVYVTPPKEAVDARQPIAQTFKEMLVPWLDVRRLGTLAAQPNFRSEPVVGSTGWVWTETDMSTPPLNTRQSFVQDRNLMASRVKREEALPVAVAVSESAGPADPHSPPRPENARPRMVVLGCSSLATNQYQAQPTVGQVGFDFIRSSVEWCRERYVNVGVQPKTHRYYTLPAKVSEGRLVWLPFLLMCCVTLGLGLIVWNMRRR